MLFVPTTDDEIVVTIDDKEGEGRFKEMFRKMFYLCFSI